ncbi:MAG: hypothetical protein KF754_04450 [Planctomycetes bacterium]|nr:hypothetical protein [Planctomycetota bacterium]
MNPARPSLFRRSTVFAAVIAVAVLAAWWMQKPGAAPKPMQISPNESLHPDEISFVEVLGQPAGAPPGFDCIQVYDVRPIDPKAAFSEPFTLNFFEGKGRNDLQLAQLVDGKWIKLEGKKPRHPDVTASIEAQQAGLYAVGRFR